jgi:hypothetical protein
VFRFLFLVKTLFFKRSMHKCTQECPAYNALLGSVALTASPELSIIFYLDEVTPGDPLKPDLKRKFYAYYISFAEFGPEVLFKEEVWLTVAVLRTTMLDGVQAGVSGATRQLLHQMFLGDVPNFTTGVAIDLKHLGAKLFRGRLRHFIADAAALKYLFDIKGASGLKNCIECRNCWKKGHGVDYPNAVTVACSDPSLYERRTDDDLYATYDFIQSQHGVVGPTRFKLLQISAGINYIPGGMLSAHDLRDIVRPISQKCDDWPHVFFQNGTFQLELQLLLERASEQNIQIGWHSFRAFSAADWKFPKTIAVHCRSVAKVMFSEGREGACEKIIKWGVSECLVAFPLIRFIFDSLVPAAELVDEMASFHALCDMVDVIVFCQEVVPLRQIVIA